MNSGVGTGSDHGFLQISREWLQVWLLTSCRSGVSSSRRLSAGPSSPAANSPTTNSVIGASNRRCTRVITRSAGMQMPGSSVS